MNPENKISIRAVTLLFLGISIVFIGISCLPGMHPANPLAGWNFNITITQPRHGKITMSPNQTTVGRDQKVVFTAIPDSAYHFANWTGDLSGSANPETLTVNKFIDVSAVFETNCHCPILTVSTPLNGTISIPPAQSDLKYGDTVQLTAIPNTGYHFLSWTGDASGSSNPLRLKMSTSMNLSALFGQDRPTSINDSMVLIPGGEFVMGPGQLRSGIWMDDTVSPAHRVTISTFYLSATECTQSKYKAVMGFNPSNFSENDNRPVENVSWFDAILFCNKLSNMELRDTVYTYSKTLSGIANPDSVGVTINYNKQGYRLPTEAEWEYACRAGTQTYYYWGGTGKIDDRGWNINDYAWWSGNSQHTTFPVAYKLKNSFGLFDMSGNVAEWCNDWYFLYDSTAQSNPIGPAIPQMHRSSYASTIPYGKVFRGGSFNAFSGELTAASRTEEQPNSSSNYIGFRVAISR